MKKKKPLPPVKKNKRNRNKYQALDPKLNLKTRFDLLDMDYLSKLGDKDKAWLNRFMEEYAHDSLDRKDLKNNLHNTPALKKDCDDRNNARNRCIYTRERAKGTLNYSEDLTKEFKKKHVNPEAELIKKIDRHLEEQLMSEEFDNVSNDSDEGGEY